MKINPYLTFGGDCKAAFEFYEKVLGGKIEMMMTHGASPMADQTAPGWRDKIMHVALSVGDFVVMGSDAPPEYFKPMQGFSVSLAIDNVAQAEKVFVALAEGGTVGMPLQQTFWALRFGMVTDRFGTPWMINCEKDA